MAFSPNVQEGKVFQYKQVISSPVAIWTISHNLGKHPAVITIDSGMTQVFGVVKYLTQNTLTVTFGSAFSGTCYLS